MAERLAEVGMVEKISHVTVWKALRGGDAGHGNLRLRRHKRREIKPADDKGTARSREVRAPARPSVRKV